MSEIHRKSAHMLLLASAGSQFVIPVYQRNYVWNKTEQVKTFLQDLRSVIESGKRHFIGMIVIYPVAGASTSSRQFYVIDGQQRLTTIFLIYFALRKRAEEEGDENSVGMINQMLFNPYALKPEFKNKLKPLTVDNTIFDAIMSGKADSLSEEGKRSNVYIAYDFILQYFRGALGSVPVSAIMDGLDKMDLIEFPLQSGDDSQQIFESINAKGKTLNPIDLIRNFVLMSIPEDKKDSFYLDNWLSVEKVFPDEKAFLAFFRHFLIVQTASIVNQGKVYDVFKEWFEAKYGGKEIAPAFELIKRYATAYQYLVTDDITNLKSKPLYEALRDSRNIKSEMPRPFLLKMTTMLLAGEIQESEYAQILLVVNSYLERRAILGIDTSGISKSMTLLPKYVEEDVKSHGVSYLEAARFNIINRNVDTAARMPTDRELHDELQYKNVYELPDAIHVFFDRYETHNSGIVPPSTMGLSIEHLLPQNGSKWAPELGLNEEEYSKQRNRLGNLTLATIHDNVVMSNNLFDFKKEILKGTAHLIMNVDVYNLPSWDVEEIDRRNERMISSIMSLYPYCPSERTYEPVTGRRSPRQAKYPTLPLTSEGLSTWLIGRNQAGAVLLGSFAKYLMDHDAGYMAKYRPDLVALVPDDADTICADLIPMKNDLIVRIKLLDPLPVCSMRTYVVPETNGWSLRWELHVEGPDNFGEALILLQQSAEAVKKKRRKINVAFDRIRFAKALKQSIGSNSALGLELTTSTVSYIRFTSPATREISKGSGSGTWIADNQLLAYEVANFSKGDIAFAWLLIGPGDAATKSKIFKLMKEEPIFAKYGSGAQPQIYQGMVRFNLWTKSDDANNESGNEEFALSRFGTFLTQELPKIEEALMRMNSKMED